MTDDARRHHYVPACYLRHFAIPQDRYEGTIHAYDRVTGKSWQSSPDKSAHERDFYRVDVEGEHPNLAENAYGPWRLASHLHTLADNKDAFMARLRESEPGISDENAEKMYATHLEFLNAKGARVVMDQTTLMRDSLELAAEIEDLLTQRCWILGVAPDGASFIASDDPVHLQPSQLEVPQNPLWSPGFGDPYTNVIVPLSPRHVLMGLPYEFTARARVRLSRNEVAAINTDLALSAYRFVYSTQPTFAQIGDDGAVVPGPTAALILKEEHPSSAERLGFFTSPWPSRIR